MAEISVTFHNSKIGSKIFYFDSVISSIKLTAIEK